MDSTNPKRPRAATAGVAQATHNNNTAGIEPTGGPVFEQLLGEERKEEDEEEELKVGAFPSQMPRLRGLHKNREDALEALRGCKRTPKNTTDTEADSQHQEQQQRQKKKQAPTQRTNESPVNHRTQQEDPQIDIMDIVRKRAIEANEEVLLMPQPPVEPSFSFDSSGNCGDEAPLSHDDGSTIVATTGAFAGAPGEGLHRRDNIRFSLVGICPPGDEEEGINTNHNNNNNTLVVDGPLDYPSITPAADGDDALAEALPVEDDECPQVDMEAQPYDMEEAKHKKLEQAKRQRKYYLALVLVFVCVVVVVILGIVIHKKNKDSKRNPPPTLAPSTTAPTDSPSSAPSGVLDYLMESLPEQTLESICCDTPQYKGWDWLLNHPNISNLEEWRKKQLFTLATFYYSLEGENWNPLIRERWMDYRKEECLWFSTGFGVFSLLNGDYHELDPRVQTPSCNEGGEFTSLFLQDLQLSGFNPSIPPEIALLTSLSKIKLVHNDVNASLSDMLPTELAQLTNLTEVQLWSNKLNGQLPSELAMMTSLTLLQLNDNYLAGQLPSELGLMTSLTWLGLYQNALTGQLPSQLGMMTSFPSLFLYENALTGQLPSEVGLMTSLTSLKLFENVLTGQLPSELGLMTSLTYLSLQDNALNGQLPSELGLLTSMGSIRLDNNALTGPLPSEVGLLTSMWDLWLSQNGLTGPIPSQLALITNLVRLGLENNTLTGSIPSELESLVVNRSLAFVTLTNNSLSGTIPEGLCSLGVFDASLNYDIGMGFDCSDQLCGCCWCPCPDSTYSDYCQTNPIYLSDEKWPGTFPSPVSGSNAITINIRTDWFASQTTFEWSTLDDSGLWELLESGSPTDRYSVHSYTMEVGSNSLYKLQIFDADEDGIRGGLAHNHKLQPIAKSCQWISSLGCHRRCF